MRPVHDLTTRRVPIGTLAPHPRNARNGDTDAIVTSLQVNGQYRPIVATADGTILAGNHTYAAAMQLGWQEIDVVLLDLDPNGPDAVRIMLADNRTADLGRYDDGLLLELLTDLPELDGTGYDAHDVDVLQAYLDGVTVAPLDAGEFDSVVDGSIGATLTIHHLTTGDIGRFRALPGEDDRERLLNLLGDAE